MKTTVLLAVFLSGTLLVGCNGSSHHDEADASPAPEPARMKFRVQEVVDQQQGGLVGLRYGVPQDWKAGGRFNWTYSDLYNPLRVSTRAESPDGSAWLETY